MASDERDRRAKASESAAERRDDSASARDVEAAARDAAAVQRDVVSRSRDQRVLANHRRQSRELASAERAGTEQDLSLAAFDLDALRDFLGRLHDYQVAVAADRRAAAQDRQAAAEDRRAAARDRELAAWARQQAAVEAAEGSPEADDYPSPTPPAGSEAPSVRPAGLTPHTELNIALRAATTREAEALVSAQRAAQLAGEVASSEEHVAATLRELTPRHDTVTDERRLALAEEATRGAQVALQRGARLEGLAKEAAAHLETATLRALLRHAATAFAELSRAEHSIASAMELLAGHEEGDRAADHRHQAEEASAAAEDALERAEELHRLEMASHSAGPRSGR